jgi:hypothetical protein
MRVLRSGDARIEDLGSGGQTPPVNSALATWLISRPCSDRPTTSLGKSEASKNAQNQATKNTSPRRDEQEHLIAEMELDDGRGSRNAS